uniref:Non-haem dioxygenase N-terminal domain-containing protein n=1 Tax=Cannabis sativa TaxID=3483 RepID=A0A803NQD1_CANSA
MCSNFKSIPMIDVSPLLAKCDDPKMGEDGGVIEVVRQLNQACTQAGFFYVKGHGIPISILQEVKEKTHKFFELPYEEKSKIKLNATAGYRGYQKVLENITKGVPDMHEAIDCYRELKPGAYGEVGKILEGHNQWPLNPPNYKEMMEKYINMCTDLSRNIMRGIALALGGSPYEFVGDRAGDPFWVVQSLVTEKPFRKWCKRHWMTNFHTAVEPLDICKQRNGKVNQADETKKVERAVYGEHLVGKVLTNFVF